jgi:hypothetical protein
VPRFTAALRDWGSEHFAATLKREILALGPSDLLLHRVTTQGGLVDGAGIDATILDTTEDDGALVVRVGIFFTEVVGGCSCGDEPASSQAYCEVQLRIDKDTAEAHIGLPEG